MMNYLKKTQSHMAPGKTKEKGMHHKEIEVQTIKGTCEKNAVVGGEMDIEKQMQFNFVREWDEPKEQVIEAMK
jgi:hypothetical protein